MNAGEQARRAAAAGTDELASTGRHRNHHGSHWTRRSSHLGLAAPKQHERVGATSLTVTATGLLDADAS
jgi:hypothetical protein